MKKKTVKSFVSLFLILNLCIALVPQNAIPAGAADTPMLIASAPSNTGLQQEFRILSVDEMVAEMGAGWNLGNTMDGHTGFTPSETLWQPTETTKELIKSVHDMGFNTVRIPTTWGNMINDEDFSIRETWISRVQDIVDYCVAQDMYVIVNIHHDGAEQTGWLRVGAEDFDAVKTKYEGVWKTIAARFKNYDEHLIFESMNEVVGPSDSKDGIIKDTARIMELNQIFVDTVRSTGSNNAERWLAVCGRYTNIENTTNEQYGFELPKDTAKNRLFVSVHYYDWSFGMLENLVQTEWAEQKTEILKWEFDKLIARFTSKGIPVILGEYGCIDKNNSIERAYHVEGVTTLCKISGVVACYWDQGAYDNTKEYDLCYTLIDRSTGETIDKIITDALIRGTLYQNKTDDQIHEIVKNTTVTEITSLDIGGNINLLLGDSTTVSTTVEPQDTNDIVLWSTNNCDVATVYNGKIRARGIGTAVITARSQSGSVEKSILVTVSPKLPPAEESSILLEDSITLEAGNSLYLAPVMEPAAEISYHFASSDEAVVTVSRIGKVLAKAPGTAHISVIAANGTAKHIKITVTPKLEKAEIELALNVFYNDADTGYYLNEVAKSTVIATGDGQYTLMFDADKDLSEEAKAAGVTGLHNITAVYIKDQAVTLGKATKSPLSTCDIFYDSIVVDGVPLTVTQTEAKSAIKSSGILDTNDPLNSWDGSYVEEVTVTDHVLNITTEPAGEVHKKIEVTFTLSNMNFVAAASDSGAVKVSAIASTDKKEYELSGAGATQELGINVGKAKAGAKIAFLSQNPAIAFIDSDKITIGEDGTATVTLYAISNGTTEITAVSENDKTLKFAITVSGIEKTTVEEPVVTNTPEPTATEAPAVTDAPSVTEAPELTKAADPETTEPTKSAEPTPAAQTGTDGEAGVGRVIVIAVIIVVVLIAGMIVAAMLILKKK